MARRKTRLKDREFFSRLDQNVAKAHHPLIPASGAAIQYIPGKMRAVLSR
jgi:hypothetical protein